MSLLEDLKEIRDRWKTFSRDHRTIMEEEDLIINDIAGGNVDDAFQAGEEQSIYDAVQTLDKLIKKYDETETVSSEGDSPDTE